MLTTKFYEKYAEIRAQIATLELAEEALKANILEDMEMSGEKKADFEFGAFTLAARKNYTYTKAVKKLEEKLKIAKINEQEKGLAKIEETQYISFKAK